MTVPYIKGLMSRSIYDANADNKVDLDKTDILADWSPTTTYGLGDGCYYNGYIYSSKVEGNLNHLPTDSSYWE